MWERLGPVDRIAGDHDEVGLRGMDLFEQLLLESAHAAHMQVADLENAQAVGRVALSEGMVARHESPRCDQRTVDRGSDGHRSGEQAGPPEQGAAGHIRCRLGTGMTVVPLHGRGAC